MTSSLTATARGSVVTGIINFPTDSYWANIVPFFFLWWRKNCQLWNTGNSNTEEGTMHREITHAQKLQSAKVYIETWSIQIFIVVPSRRWRCCIRINMYTMIFARYITILLCFNYQEIYIDLKLPGKYTSVLGLLMSNHLQFKIESYSGFKLVH